MTHLTFDARKDRRSPDPRRSRLEGEWRRIDSPEPMILGPAGGHRDQTTHYRQGDPMRKLAVNTFMSLDGVMQAPGGPEEDPTGGFTPRGRGVNYFDDQMMGQMADPPPYELLLRRGAHENFAAHRAHHEGPLAHALHNTPQH